jgi:hypothetical protein
MVNAEHPENSASGNGIRGGIAVHYLNIGAPQPDAQRLGEVLIGFNCGQARQCRSQTVRRKARTRTGLEDVRPKLGAGEHPWYPPFHRPSPTSRATKPMMQLIQESSSTGTVPTC